MLATIRYDREKALLYARRWAFDRNPLFENYTGIGGDCTNFVSQCIYSGSCVMNYTPTFGWYYISPTNRAPAWTGVRFFYDFMTTNESVGPYGREVNPSGLDIGDVVQLGNEANEYYHTLIVTGFSTEGYLIAAHSNDAFDRPLSSYEYYTARFIKIDGVRIEIPDIYAPDCFTDFIEGIGF